MEKMWEESERLRLLAFYHLNAITGKTNSIDTRRTVFFRQTPHLKRNLHQRPWYRSRQDDAAKRVVHEGLEVSLSRAFVLISTPIPFPATVKVHILPTPIAGLTLTSIAASSGSSSRRCTSIGPLTAPIIE